MSPKPVDVGPVDDKIQMIEVQFPKGVDFPPGFERALDGLVGMICEAYEKANPYRVMWPSGRGGRPNMMAIHTDDHENMFDSRVWHIGVSEREASPRDLQNRGYTLCETTCPECSLQQFLPKINELPEPGWVVCPNRHWHESGAGQGIPIETIHILSGGKPLCAFSILVPGEWPKDHKWTSFMSKDVLKEATCELCLRVYKKMKDGS